MKFEKVWLVHMSVVALIFLVGYYLFTTMVYTLETTPDIKEIGGPPVYDLRLVAIIVVSALIICGVALKNLSSIDDELKP